MCCALGPATFAHTRIYAGEVERDRRVVHVLAYQNTAQNHIPPRGRLARALRGPTPHNAMLLHFPAAEPMGPENCVDTSRARDLFEAMVGAAFPFPQKDEVSGAIAAAPDRARVFEVSDYSIVLANDARAIPDAIARVPAERRPLMNRAVFDWYAQRFPGWPVALCCFSADVRRPAPLLWWYLPREPELLFAPALDAHDGRPPRTDSAVDVSHLMFFGSHRAEAGGEVRWDAHDIHDPAVRALMPRRVVGVDAFGRTQNGDFTVAVADVRRGEAELARRAPPA